ncbi:MAG: alpha/beta hydrolase [bacterium]|nr:alpha/beta hydrolase [bacterium]
MLLDKSQEYIEKNTSVGGMNINYKIAGEGPAVLVLHGWGRGSDAWIGVQAMLSRAGYRVIVPDLPGFGKSALPATAWGIKEYAEFVKEFADTLGLQEFFLVGHSFGGQTAAMFATLYPQRVLRLILVGAAVVRRKPSLYTRSLSFVAKTGNMFFSFWPFSLLQPIIRKVFYKFLGSSDHLYTKGIMKEVRKNVIQEDLRYLLSHISKRTLIVWGDQDVTTPTKDAYIIQKLIPGSILKVVPGANHSFNGKESELISTMLEFLKQ